METNTRALIIFTRNPVAGRVKTRLARAVGDERALAIHNELVGITARMTGKLPASIDCHLFFDDAVPASDPWTGRRCHSHVQAKSADLGDRMLDAFQRLFTIGYQSVVIIGTDCPYLDAPLVASAFTGLETNEMVIGPARDGGFYLLGVKEMSALQFAGITWSTSSVFEEFMDATPVGKSEVCVLETLEDIDDIQAYNTFQMFCKNLKNNTL